MNERQIRYRSRERGVAAVLAMMFLVIFGSLAAAMARSAAFAAMSAASAVAVRRSLSERSRLAARAAGEPCSWAATGAAFRDAWTVGADRPIDKASAKKRLLRRYIINPTMVNNHS